jgi:hypothetical protein
VAPRQLKGHLLGAQAQHVAAQPDQKSKAGAVPSESERAAVAYIRLQHLTKKLPAR